MKKLIMIAALALVPAFSSSALAQSPAASAAAMSTQNTTVGELLDNPASKAIVDKYIPGFSDNPQIDMARGMTLAAIQPFAADQVTDEALQKIDADLTKLPVKK